jgi:hypothetical protein
VLLAFAFYVVRNLLGFFGATCGIAIFISKSWCLLVDHIRTYFSKKSVLDEPEMTP